MLLLLARVLQKLVRDRAGVDALGHEIMALVTQHADNLRRQRFVEKLDRGFGIAAVARGHRAFLDVLARALAQGLYVGEKWRVFDGCWLVAHGCSLIDVPDGNPNGPRPQLYIQHESCLRQMPVCDCQTRPSSA